MTKEEETVFTGFTEEAVQFLWGIRLNNERPWFEAHKQQYIDCVQTPMRELAREVYTAFTEKHSELMLMSKVSRIYRDARRLYGRGPYKSHLWFSMRLPGEEGKELPGFWFELSPSGYGYGMGIYPPRPAAMAKLRQAIDRDPTPMLKLARDLQKQSRFTLGGESYRRSKGTAEPPLDEWYNRKTVDLSCARPVDELLSSPALVDELLDGYETLLPCYRYLMSLLQRADG